MSRIHARLVIVIIVFGLGFFGFAQAQEPTLVRADLAKDGRGGPPFTINGRAENVTGPLLACVYSLEGGRPSFVQYGRNGNYSSTGIANFRVQQIRSPSKKLGLKIFGGREECPETMETNSFDKTWQ